MVEKILMGWFLFLNAWLFKSTFTLLVLKILRVVSSLYVPGPLLYEGHLLTLFVMPPLPFAFAPPSYSSLEETMTCYVTFKYYCCCKNH